MFSDKKEHELVERFSISKFDQLLLPCSALSGWLSCFAALQCLFLRQFSRTVAPTTSTSVALCALMRHYKWGKAVLLTSADEIWLDSGVAITRQLRTVGTEVLDLRAFQPGEFTTGLLAETKRSGIRIIILMAYQGTHAHVRTHASTRTHTRTHARARAHTHRR